MAVEFTIDDFANELQQLKQMYGRRAPDPLSQFADFFRENRDATLSRLERIVSAIPPNLRDNPDRINPDEQQRIAAVAEVTVEEVEHFLDYFRNFRVLQRSLAEVSLWQRIKILLGW